MATWQTPVTNWTKQKPVSYVDLNRMEGNTQWLYDNAIIEVQSATAPIAPVIGDRWYDTTNNRPKYWNGTAWIDPLKYQ
jgi:hypothetical protein